MYQQSSYGQVLARQFPKCPHGEPPIAFNTCVWEHLGFEKAAENGPVITAFVYPCNDYRELEVLEVGKTYIDCIFGRVCKKKKGSSIFCIKG
jgi:hypothetical protein